MARYRAEHASVGSFDGTDAFTVESGNEALLPEWPPVVNLPGLAGPGGG